MSTTELNNVETEEENKTPDKKQIEAEEKEIMLKSDTENVASEAKPESEGPVKAALATEVTEQGREVKPKFIPIGAIKMPGFFTRNSDKDKNKEEVEGAEKDGDEKDESKPKRHRLQFLHACPFTKFLHHPPNQPQNEGEPAAPNSDRRWVLPKLPANLTNLNIKYPKFLQRGTAKDPEAALASMETLEDKVESPNDGMENVKLDTAADEPDEGKVATKLPLKERIRQKKFIIDDIVVACLGFLVLLAVIIGVAVGASAGPPAERPLRLGKYMTTLTSCGPVEGVRNESVYKFYSIPYAAPPLSERRFAYAQPLNNISMCWNDTRPAHQPGPYCLQFLDNGTITGQEDCLTLDVVTPHVRYDSPLPVVVLIGANTLAGGISPAQPSALYAHTKEVVFVRPNFRLGALGFLSLDILAKTKYPPSSGNYALSDLIEALRWVQYNIKHFGGDPAAVTLLGHRAGATLVAALTTVKKAQDLYARVWLASPSVIFPGEPLEVANKNNEQFKELSKCYDVDCLRRISSTQVLTSTPDTWLGKDIDTLPQKDEQRRSWLVLDGDLLREHAYESWKSQKEAKETRGKEKMFKPMIFGTTQQSAHSEFLKLKHLNWNAEIVERMVNESVIGEKNLTGDVFKIVNKTYDGLVELTSAVRTLCPLVSLARMRLLVPMYVVLGSGAGSGANGTRIADVDADVQAILGTFDSEGPEQRRFMAAMQQLFYYYVWHGRLAGPESGIIAVDQDLLPIKGFELCDLLIGKDIVPRHAHVD